MALRRFMENEMASNTYRSNNPIPVFDSVFTAFPDYQRVKKRSSALGTTFSDFARREFSECLRQGNPGSP
jgi:hypothetical protein